MRDAGGFKGDARVVRRQTNHCLHELHLYDKKAILEALKASVKDDRTLSHRVDAGNDLRSELGDYHHNDASQEAGLQKQGLRVELQIQVRVKDSHLDDLRDVEQEFSVVAVDRCQLGGKEDETHDKDLGDSMNKCWRKYFDTWRPKRNRSMLSPLAAICPSLNMILIHRKDCCWMGELVVPIRLWVTFPVRRRILTFELYQGDLGNFLL